MNGAVWFMISYWPGQTWINPKRRTICQQPMKEEPSLRSTRGEDKIILSQIMYFPISVLKSSKTSRKTAPLIQTLISTYCSVDTKCLEPPPPVFSLIWEEEKWENNEEDWIWILLQPGNISISATQSPSQYAPPCSWYPFLPSAGTCCLVWPAERFDQF